jgi:cellulose synthase/poly-beta-1,6-N-acetylglucosamine synthase-like glycosyltransferase
VVSAERRLRSQKSSISRISINFLFWYLQYHSNVVVQILRILHSYLTPRFGRVGIICTRFAKSMHVTAAILILSRECAQRSIAIALLDTVLPWYCSISMCVKYYCIFDVRLQATSPACLG